MWSHAIFVCQVQFGHMVLLQGFSDCNAAWGWIPFHFSLIIHSRGYTASSPAHLRNQSCLVVSSQEQNTCIFSHHPKRFSSIKLGQWYSPGCCITKTPKRDKSHNAECLDKQFLALSRRDRFPQRAIQKRLAFHTIIQRTAVQPSRLCS